MSDIKQISYNLDIVGQAIEVEVVEAVVYSVELTTAAPGVGIPAGGTVGQVLAKATGDDYDTEWVDQAAGGGAVDSVNGQTGTVVLDTDDIDEGATNLYHTEARVAANTEVAANTAARHTHTNKAELDLVTDGDHDQRTDNPHGVTPAQIGAAPTAHTHLVGDLNQSGANLGDGLFWNGSAWAPADAGSGPVAPSDLEAEGADDDDALMFNGTIWAPRQIVMDDLGAGGGTQVNSGVRWNGSRWAPHQQVISRSKTADESRTSNVIAIDNEFVFTLYSNRIYKLDLVLYYAADISPDLAFSLVKTLNLSDATCGYRAPGSSGGTLVNTWDTRLRFNGGGVTTFRMEPAYGFIQTGASSGEFAVYWGMDSAAAGQAIMAAGSTLILTDCTPL